MTIHVPPRLTWRDLHRLPEYWIADPVRPALHSLALRDGRYVGVEPDAGGRLRSTVAPDLLLDPATLLERLDE